MTTIIKNNGEEEIFDPEKLRNSLKKSGATVFVINDIVNKIEKRLKDGMSTSEIYHKAFDMLKKTEEKSAIKYSLRRSIFSLGPSGFPFESFIAEVMEAKGYKVRKDQVLDGECVPHEIDVVAYNKDELLFIEAKFHNDISIKSDTKVALYIKARFDDLKDSVFRIENDRRKMTRGVLVTNTKFTENALRYGKCADTFDMISWDYPKNGNLYDLIYETGLHPMTCIPQLSKKQKQDLLQRGITTCNALKANDTIMREIGVPKKKVDHIIRNIDAICSHE